MWWNCDICLPLCQSLEWDERHFSNKKISIIHIQDERSGTRVDITLGIKVKQIVRLINYVDHTMLKKMLNKLNHLKFKDVKTLFNPRLKLEKNIERVVTQLEYASAISCLIFFM